MNIIDIILNRITKIKVFPLVLFLIFIGQIRLALFILLVNLIINYKSNIANFFNLDFFKDTTKESEVWVKESEKNNIKNKIKMPNLKFKTLLVAIFSITIFLVAIDGFVSIPAGHVGVVFDRGRGVLEKSVPSGLHLKIPFWQNVIKMSVRIQEYTMSIAQGEGDKYGDDAIEALTKDGQKVYVDLTAQYFILAQNAPKVYQNIGNDYVNIIIRPAVRATVREATTAFESKELYSSESRTEFNKKAFELLKNKLETNNINLEDLLIRNIKFSDVYINAIEEKQVAQQKIEKARFEKQEAEQIKERKIIEASAEAEAINIKGEALKNNPQMLELNKIEKLNPNIQWGVLPDGILPLMNIRN